MFLKAFSLIELMIIIVVIGILAVIAFHTYSDYVKKAEYSEMISLLSSYKNDIVEQYTVNGKFPDSVNNTSQNQDNVTTVEGLRHASAFHYNIGASMETAWWGYRISDPSDATIFMCYDMTSGSPVFRCGTWDASASNLIIRNFLPANCQDSVNVCNI